MSELVDDPSPEVRARMREVADRMTRALEDRVLSTMVGDGACRNSHTTTGLSWMEAQMDRYRRTEPPIRLNDKVSIVDCTP